MESLPKPQDIFDTLLIVNAAKKVKADDAEYVSGILKQAFGKKILEIHVIDAQKLVFGINFDQAEDISSKVIRGPHPKAEDAPDFVKFWNNKSTIHRFTDGSLAEGIDLKTDNPVIETAQLALQIHYDPKVSIELANRDINSIFEIGGKELPQADPQSAFDELTTKLITLQDLTISISNVIPTSPFLRKTAVFPYSLVSEKSDYNSLAPEVIKIIIKLEGFSAWPTRQREVVPFKVAAFLAISKALAKLNIESRTTPTGIEILFRGYVFSAVGIHNNELSDFEGTVYGKQLEQLERVDRLQHANVLAMSNKYNSFSIAVRAAIRWMRCKCVASELFTSEAIELLMIYIYENTIPPKFAFTAFARFLSLLSHLDDSHQNVFSILEASPDLAHDDKRLLIVAAPHCRKSEYTSRGPSQSVIKYIRAAARDSLKTIVERELKISQHQATLEKVFGTPTNKWNFVIKVNHKERPFAGRVIFSKQNFHGKYDVRGSGVAPKLDSLMPGFDPVHMLVEEIAERYGSVLSIWYNEFGGPSIGLSLSEDTLNKELPLEPQNMNSAKLSESGKLKLDVEDVMQQIRIIGGEIIKSLDHKL
ncbi:hypothetical protein TVAG_020100 [Trichomonas vaginalis G3]|uniref:Nucleolar protein 6 n=1 Tax=Trichomonas vaginalis (strain ATCC PRA-98 / G3) TaxID=412133 RepID=A2EPZ9_TRIV3|nr:tRNA export from nucleus [Trichomonas vaginalis G3]EAY05264.1 hypothetical protein TVAG_020100 [Trichomonas vaginalis G3]KAI5530459.1 tRNA export from nucleus [Trichomonas vaginalis G3]|eukprot:XP_001317487.1 hypothetical protein [Trichomonas vaginalis G3]